MAPGARKKSGAPVFEPEVFQKQKHRIEVSTKEFLAPSADIRRPGNCAPFLPRYAPALAVAISQILIIKMTALSKTGCTFTKTEEFRGGELRFLFYRCQSWCDDAFAMRTLQA